MSITMLRTRVVAVGTLDSLEAMKKGGKCGAAMVPVEKDSGARIRKLYSIIFGHEAESQKSATSNLPNDIKPTNINQPITDSMAASDAKPPGAQREPSSKAAGVPPDMPAVHTN